MSKVVLVLAVVLLVGGGAFYYFRQSAEAPAGDSMKEDEAAMMAEKDKKMVEEDIKMTEDKMMESGNIIKFTESGFTPKEVKIKVGETVTFKNESSRTVAPASAMHPTHKAYPGSDINKCGTADQSKIFDSCAGIPAGKMWSFTFTQKGSWGYHNHLNPKDFGKIIVE